MSGAWTGALLPFPPELLLAGTKFFLLVGSTASLACPPRPTETPNTTSRRCCTHRVEMLVRKRLLRETTV